MLCIECKVKKDCIVLFFSSVMPGGDKFQKIKDSVGNYLAGWSATMSRSVIPVEK